MRYRLAHDHLQLQQLFLAQLGHRCRSKDLTKVNSRVFWQLPLHLPQGLVPHRV